MKSAGLSAIAFNIFLQSMTIFLISTIVFSGVAVFAMVYKGYSNVKNMSDEEINKGLSASMPVFHDFHRATVVPSVDYWKNTALPWVYKETEKIVSRFRINILKMERKLHSFTNYIRGKREISGNNGNEGQSQYWNNVNDFKNNLNGEDKK